MRCGGRAFFVPTLASRYAEEVVIAKSLVCVLSILNMTGGTLSMLKPPGDATGSPRLLGCGLEAIGFSEPLQCPVVWTCPALSHLVAVLESGGVSTRVSGPVVSPSVPEWPWGLQFPRCFPDPGVPLFGPLAARWPCTSCACLPGRCVRAEEAKRRGGNFSSLSV